MGSSRSLPRDHEQLSKKGNRVQILDGVASTSVAYIPRAPGRVARFFMSAIAA